MAIDIKFDLNGNPEPPTIILANRNGNKLGQLKVDETSIDISDKFNDASELSFTLYKPVEENIDNTLDEKTRKKIYEELINLWNKVIDFKLVYCKEWDLWFEIKVELDEATETIKTVFCTQLGQAELSQIMLYNIEINTEEDIARDDYKISILYDKNSPKYSILNRLLEKAPHYSIAHVDDTIANIQRSFSFNDTSIVDAFQEIAEEIGCLFVYNSNSDENGNIQRTISVYDLEQNCLNEDCRYRGEFTDKCPKCGSTDIKYGYGEDTLIFITSDELASGGIQLTTDTDSVKSCFKLEAGDDLMTATVRNCNPNGTDYIWRFSNVIKEDMSDELVNKLELYNELYKDYYSNYVSEINESLITKYNTLVDKYKVYYNTESTCLNCDTKGKFYDVCSNCGSENLLLGNELQKIETPVKGYSSLMNAYYNAIDLELYLKSGLMPSVEMEETSAEEQASLLTSDALSPVAVADVTIASLATMNSAVLAMAKIIVKPTYKVQVNTSEIVDDTNSRFWRGNFIVTNYSDEEDTAISNIISVSVNDDLETSTKQKIDKALNKEDTDDYSISGLFKKEYDDFCIELKKYALNPLVSFKDACQSCIDILIEQGVSNDTTWSDEEDGSDANLYEKLYVPYYNKLKAIEAEIKVREDEINIITGVYDIDGNLTIDGIQTDIEKCKTNIQDALNFERYLGVELWLEFCAYRREDKYSNDNYISDGLNNAELFKRAREFFEIAENEIYKSSEIQHSISTNLNNLLSIKKFKSLVKSFKVGNWIRVRIDDRIYKLRLLEYNINYGDFDNISVEFSDVTKIKNGITDVENILSQASTMATSYSSVKRQAIQGKESNIILNNLVENGLNATNVKIVSSNNQNQIWDKNGILCREYDPITETYSDEQLKIINSTMAITDDNWETTKTAIGKIFYIDPQDGKVKSTYGVNAETIIGKLLIGEQLDISNESGSLKFGAYGLVVRDEDDINTVIINPDDKDSIFKITNGDKNIFSFNEKGELVIIGNITASSLTLLDNTTIESKNISGLADVAITGSYEDLTNKPTYSTVATSGSYKDLIDIEELNTELKNWTTSQIQQSIDITWEVSY